MSRLTLIFLLSFGWLQYSFWFGKNGVVDYLRIEQSIHNQQQSNHELQIRNKQLIAEINSLSTGLDAIEERARSELGMIKPTERFYRIIVETGTNENKTGLNE